MNRALLEVAQELAERESRSQFPASIHWQDAIDQVDADLCGQWFANECAESPPDVVLLDIVQSVNAQQASAIFCGLFRDSDLSRFTLANAVREYIASQIADAANELMETMGEQGEPWDDPVRADRIAIAHGRRDF